MKKLIFFDFDGVIYQNFDISYELILMEFPDLAKEEYINWFSGNVYESINRYAGRQIEVLDEQYWSAYLNKMMSIQPFRGIAGVIEGFYKQGKILLIVSSSRTAEIKQILEKDNLHQYFTDILGADKGESKTAKIGSALKEYNCLPEETIIITDTSGDIEEAEKVGVKAIAVSWGYQSAKTLIKSNPLNIIHSANELVL